MLLIVVSPVVPSSRAAAAETFAQTESFADFGAWDWSGAVRAQVNFVVEQKPSSLRGQPRTDWGSFKFQSRLSSREEPVALVIGAHVGPERDTNHREPIMAWDQLKMEWTGGPLVAMGLLQDPIVDFAWSSFWGADYGSDFEPGLSKWKMIPRSDLGVSLAQEWSGFWWRLQATNGEGWPQKETGARKDFEIVIEKIRQFSDSSAGVQVFGRSGGYDQLGDDSNVKERLGVQIVSQGLEWSWGGLLMGLRDSVDGMTGVLGEGVDLSARGGEVTQGSLREAWAGYRWGEPNRFWRVFGRTSLYSADHDDSTKELKQNAIGVSRDLGRSGMSVALSYQATEFGPNYAALTQDRSRWMLSWVWGLTRRGSP